MHSELRRPSSIHLDRFVAALDERLRHEVRVTRRVLVPIAVTRLIRSLKIRSMAFVQGGALALTALAVMVAVGIGPAVNSQWHNGPSEPLAAPSIHSDSLLLVKSRTSAFGVAIEGRHTTLVTRGIYQ